MAAPTKDFEIDRGDAIYIDFQAFDYKGKPMDLTGAVVRFTVKNTPFDNDPGLFQLTAGSGITLIDIVNGIGFVRIAPSQTSSFTSKKNLYYDLQATDAAGDPHTLLKGRLLVDLDITRTSP